MDQNMIGVLVISAIIIAVAFFIVYKVLQALKGSLKITLLQTAYREGESITGSLELEAKQAIEAKRLFVALIGTRITRHFHKGHSKTSYQEVYRDERSVEGAKSYAEGTTARYDFAVPVPPREKVLSFDGPLGDILKVGLALATNQNGSMRWRLEARLDAKGIDLTAGQDITFIG